MESAVLLLDEEDNVGVAVCDLNGGADYSVIGHPEHIVTPRENIRFGHKVALQDIPEGSPVFKYGEVIGTALEDIPRGTWIHTHNMQSPF